MVRPNGIEPEAVKERPTLDAKGRLKKYPLPVGRARGLHELAGEFAFFTPALLYLHARFVDAPLFDWMWELGREVKIYYHRFQKPVFKGLHSAAGDPGWNHALLAVRPDDWQGLSDFLCSLAWSVRDAKVMFNFGEQDLTIVDPLAADLAGVRHPGLPTIGVTAFGLHGSAFRAAFVRPNNPSVPGQEGDVKMYIGLPEARLFKPTPEMTEFARNYYAGTNPVNARDVARHLERVTKAQEELRR